MKILQEAESTISCFIASPGFLPLLLHAVSCVSSGATGVHGPADLHAALCCSSESFWLPRLLCSMQACLSTSSPLAAFGLREANAPGSCHALLSRV